MRFWIFVLAGSMGVSASAQQPPMSLTGLQQFMAMVRQQVDSGESWTRAEGQHVILNYVAGDPANTPARVKDLVATYDKCVQDDCSVLSLTAPEPKLPVFLFPKLTDLQAAIHAPISGPVSMRGWSALTDNGKGTSDQARATAAHEIGHALVYDQVGLYGCPLFAEGIADYLGSREVGEAWLKDPKPVTPVPLRTLTLSAHTDEDFRDGAAFLAYLMRRDGQDPTRVKAVLAAISKERLDDLRKPGMKPWPDRVEGAFESVYGATLDQLDAQWRKAGTGGTQKPVRKS